MLAVEAGVYGWDAAEVAEAAYSALSRASEQTEDFSETRFVLFTLRAGTLTSFEVRSDALTWAQNARNGNEARTSSKGGPFDESSNLVRLG